MLGRGDGTFAPQQRFAVGFGPASVAVADLNHDGRPDLVTANRGGFEGLSTDVSVLLGRGDGTFAPQQRFAVGLGPLSVAVGDLNGDGHPDLVTANVGSHDVSVLLGRGDGTFVPQQRFAVGASAAPASVVVGDLNGNGIPDLVTANLQFGDVSVLLGRGDGTFAAAQRFAVGASPRSVAVGDLNGDGIPDLVTANEFSDDVSVLLGRGDGTFAAEQRFAVGGGPVSVAMADFNNDITPDLVTANAGFSAVSILLGRGDGTFVKLQLAPP